MTKIKYHHAYNENNEIVSINDIIKEERHLHTYKCIVCGEYLSPRMGEERAWHFWHEKNTKCNGETYIHKLAKIRIKEMFDNSKHLYISFRGKKICNSEKCEFRNNYCIEDDFITIDLKEIYDTATIECNYQNFTADILLSNSKNDQQEPIFFEIFVKHKCEQEKIDSGIKIIEIRIKNEEDIKRITSKNTIEEYFYKKESVSFFSFNRECKCKLLSDIYRYAEKNGHQIGYIKSIPCNKANYKLYADSTMELNAVYKLGYGGDINSLDYIKWLQDNKNRRSCLHCKYHHNKCALHNKLGTPEYPQNNFADTCKYYRLIEFLGCDNEGLYITEVNEPYKKISTFKVAIIIDGDFNDYILFKKKCDFYLKNKFDNSNIIIYDGWQEYCNEMCASYQMERKLEYEKCKSPYELLITIDAVIVFWDGQTKEIKQFIDQANNRNILVRKIDINDI